MFLCHLVSVPYRGATFLNKNCKSLASAKRVSVPYRGATFLNANNYTHEQATAGFRPLSGSYISQLIDARSELVSLVSVPYRGATFLNSRAFFLSDILRTVSVPYRGATFLNYAGETADIKAMVSVPYRGATFLNTISATPCPVWDE